MKNKNRLLTTVICLVFVTVLQARNIKLPLSLLNINVPQLLNEPNTDNLFVSENAVNQSDRKIKGTIMDENGDPIIGANVMVKGTSEGTITDLDGKFFMSVPDKAVLAISYVGYIKQEIEVTGKSSFHIILIEDTKILDEVVIVGYGVQKKTTLTGAVSSIDGGDLAEMPVANAAQTISGKVAGVSMRPNGGQPGFDTPDIHIRGIVTTGNNKPLIVVDGIKRDNLNQIDPANIENITILKDAAATAPYGIGGANGVVLITTKRGKKGKPTVSLSTSVGFQNPTYTPDVLSAKDYMALQNEGYYNIVPDGATPPYDAETVANYDQLHQEDPYRYPSSNFTDVYNNNALMQKYNIDVNGGTDIVQYDAGISYYDQNSLFDKINYNRFNYNLALDVKVTNTTKMSMSFMGSREEVNQLDPGENTTSGHLFRQFYRFVPTQTILYPSGDKWGQSSGGSPMAALNSEGYDKQTKNVLLTSFTVEQELPFLEGLRAKGTFSYDPTYTFQKQWHLPFHYSQINLNTDPYTFEDAITNNEGNSTSYIWLNQKDTKSYNYTWQGQLNYGHVFGDHNVSGLFVVEGRKSNGNWFNARRNNYTVAIDELNMGSSSKDDFETGGTSWSASELGFVYRLGYIYKDRYSFEASGRYDGHYYFAPGSRWAYFPSFSGAWRISEEPFMQQYTNIDNLKIRGSWGKSGMLAGSAFQYLAGYTLSGEAYAFGSGNLVQGSSASFEANPNITWEISKKTDIGVDLNMWGGLLNIEVDYFHEHRSGMLLEPQVTVPVEYGLDLAQENKGVMENNGFEMTLGTYKKYSNDMEFHLNANVSYAKNKMIEVFETDAERNNPNRTKYGKPFGTPFGFKSLGLFSTSDDTNGDGMINADDGYNVIQFGNLYPGDIRYADLSGPDGVPDGKIDDNDQTKIGNPVYPLLTFGLTPEVSWKGFDLSLFFQGSGVSSINNRTFMTVPFSNNGSNTTYEYYDNRWTTDNQNEKYPRSTPSPIANNSKDSDFWMENTTFVRLKTLTFGYTLPKVLTQKWFMQSIRLYVVSQNLFTLSGLSHMDPEVGYSRRETAFPVMKTTNFGIDIKF